MKKGEWEKVNNDDDLIWMMLATSQESPRKETDGVIEVKDEPESQDETEGPASKRQKRNESPNDSTMDCSDDRAEPVQPTDAGDVEKNDEGEAEMENEVEDDDDNLFGSDTAESVS